MPPSPSPRNARSKPPTTEAQKIAAEWAKAKRIKDAEDAVKSAAKPSDADEARRALLERRRKSAFESRCSWTVGFWIWLLFMHVVGIVLFTSGFLLTRLVLDERSECAVPPTEPLIQWEGSGTIDGGCWHPKTFNKAVVVIIDALRYDFTVPTEDSEAEVYHNAFPFLHQSAVESPNNAFLLPFIADPPTSTLQRLKGLTTGTLPTFIDLGSNFAGTAIEEDNILMQLREHGKRIVHLGDDTWTALFPDYFQPNLSKAYDSFNVWDLHTVDNGVLDHIFPLMEPEFRGDWDIAIGHLLGVDHAGHRYGPNHPAMTAKLQQMNTFISQLTQSIDEDTLLVVMGDHGMDGKGDHGGESDDEVEAALWMYSKRPVFGRTQPDFATPPATAKIRPVNQIDLVPTLALLLGIPIPFNNLGRPIEEAFAGPKGNAWDHLAAASSVTSAGIKRYQASYFTARGLQQSSTPGSPASLWTDAEDLINESTKSKNWAALYAAYTAYQRETLKICKDLWARFNVPNMILGIVVMTFSVVVLLLYVSRDEDEDFAVLDDVELDLAEKTLELQGVSVDADAASYKTLTKALVKSGGLSGIVVGLVSSAAVVVTGSEEWLRAGAATAIGSMASVAITLLSSGGKNVFSLLPDNFWGWLSIIFTASQSIGFASNSYTIWEDSISLFFLATFGVASAMAALRRPTLREQSLGVYHSLLFVVLSRVASFSKLCREEQMPYCKSTYYASANSSTSAPWQLVVPFAVFLLLPSIIQSYLQTSKSYEGLAPVWIGYVFRGTLLLSAGYWTLDAASNSNWLTSISETAFKTIHVSIAQVVLALALVAGSTAFIWAPPCVSIITTSANKRTAQVTVLGYGNANGARYLFLPINIACACILLTKPMGSGAIAIMLWQVLALAEILDINGIAAETIGPVTLALLGNYHYFKTGHQAVLSSIQWDAAFIPVLTVRYPWSAMAVALNHFAGQILACVAVPLLVIWKTSPKRKGVLESVSRALGIFVAYYAVESLATMAWAGHLRRHLMLYRVFSPRFMMAAAVLLIVDLVGVAVTLLGVRTNVLAISDVFGFAD
ncbi:GPI ethanolamine phosphate transferase 3-like protein [Xylaria bambusicola]|uniref:GPI ethanolamine phosphate transferase 3-like protein n=1 Tax=Xylaria bambusicola TaxID=326684 RepID=UPI0020081558|nr:GPI ethanolamine phosphate transferase 3-like protein [Xylaria bambusicola]KAI0527899.1 GPI ethanolamine phosphate transferase 3-like protein [Xylaria bambusicola]